MTYTEDGHIKLKTGTIIKHGNLEKLTQEDILEISASPASLFDILAIRKNQHELRNEVQKIFKKFDNLDDKIARTILETHTCPADLKKINHMIDEKIQAKIDDYKDSDSQAYKRLNERIDKRVGEVMKEKLFTSANVMKALTVIFVFLGAWGSLFYLLIKLTSGKN